MEKADIPIELTKDEQNAVVSRITSRLIPVLFCMSLLCYLDRANLSFAAIDMNHTLHFDDVRIANWQ